MLGHEPRGLGVSLAEHLMPDDSLYAPFIGPAEALAGKLTEAGFDDEAAVPDSLLIAMYFVMQS
ncbi:hypothetical protein [Streptomyces sp. DSM 15324]|uniref:hypothetical protein n=1 Tax=Streptomyces sp. DSM 15324 TaxID=1739111 RepID=UPI00131BF002|nr:hypothetical protein [Streptomyces sp. DSM 15324]